MSNSYAKFSELLTRDGVRAVDVAKATGISTSTLSDWKAGKTIPKLDKIVKIAKYFNVAIEEFCD